MILVSLKLEMILVFYIILARNNGTSKPIQHIAIIRKNQTLCSNTNASITVGPIRVEINITIMRTLLHRIFQGCSIKPNSFKSRETTDRKVPMIGFMLITDSTLAPGISSNDRKQMISLSNCEDEPIP